MYAIVFNLIDGEQNGLHSSLFVNTIPSLM